MEDVFFSFFVIKTEDPDIKLRDNRKFFLLLTTDVDFYRSQN